MTRTHATIAITALVVLFIIGIIDQIQPPYAFAADGVLKTVGAILIGVAIAAIVAGMGRTDSDGNVIKHEHQHQHKHDGGGDE